MFNKKSNSAKWAVIPLVVIAIALTIVSGVSPTVFLPPAQAAVEVPQACDYVWCYEIEAEVISNAVMVDVSDDFVLDSIGVPALVLNDESAFWLNVPEINEIVSAHEATQVLAVEPVSTVAENVVSEQVAEPEVVQTARTFGGFPGVQASDSFDFYRKCSLAHAYFEQGNTFEFTDDLGSRAAISLSTRGSHILVRAKNNKCVESSFLHELFHWADFMQAGDLYWMSDGTAWQRAFRAEAHMLSDYSHAANLASGFEFFAEAHSVFHACNDGWMEKNMPNTYFLLKNFC